MNPETHIKPIDREIWERELSDFVPDVIFDAHTHLWNDAHKGDIPGPPDRLRTPVSMDDLSVWTDALFPGRKHNFLLVGLPLKDMDTEAHNTWIADCARGRHGTYASMVVTPDMTPEYVAEQVRQHGFVGMKPYRWFAPDEAEGRIAEYLPEALMEVGDQMGITVTLHISRSRAMADPDNIRDIKKFSSRYPNLKWIMAHCARAFNPVNLENVIDELKDLPNVWFDTSAVCDLYSHYLIMKHVPERTVFGTDNVAAGCMRGNYITYGYSWEAYEGNAGLEHCDATATLVVYEQLRSQKRAADMLEWSRQDINRLFSDNVAELFASS